MANDKNFVIKNGLQAGRYLNTNGTETAGSGPVYDLSTAEYDGVNFLTSSQDSQPIQVVFKSDGTKLYLLGSAARSVYQYSLSTAYDLSTISYDSVSFSAATQENTPRGLAFKADGTKLYVSGPTSDSVHQYSLSTAWDVSTASYDSVSFSFASQELNPYQIFFKTDGTKLYVVGNTGDDINEYDLSTAWDVSSASFSQNFSVASEDATPVGLFFRPDGTKMYITGQSNDRIFQYDLSTAWDVSTASYDSVSFDVSSQAVNPSCVTFDSGGAKMVIVGQTTDTIYQYSTVSYTQTLDLSTGTTFSFTTSGATTVSFTNAPASGKAIGFSVEIVGDGSAITWPTSVKWPAGVAPTTTASKELYSFVTTDGGTTYYGNKAGGDIA